MDALPDAPLAPPAADAACSKGARVGLAFIPTRFVPHSPSCIASSENIVGRQIIDKCGVFARQMGGLDVVREKFERIGRANIMLVSASSVASHLLGRVPASANLATFHLPESFDPIVEQIVQATAEALGLLVSEIADVERRILKFPPEPRSARLKPALP
jgi:hypothetical protein